VKTLYLRSPSLYTDCTFDPLCGIKDESQHMYWTDVRFCTGLLMEEALLRLVSSVFQNASSGISLAKRCFLIVVVVFGCLEQQLM
jgi:hypothetical protein